MKALLVAGLGGLVLAGVARGHLGGGALLMLVLAVAGCWVLSGRTSGRSAVGHGHGDKVRLHEGAHIAAAKAMGAAIKAAWVRGSSGLVELRNPERLTSREYMAFMKSGEAATGGEGCSGDRANVRAEKQRMRATGMSAAEIRKVERQAGGDARRYARGAMKWGATL